MMIGDLLKNVLSQGDKGIKEYKQDKTIKDECLFNCNSIQKRLELEISKKVRITESCPIYLSYILEYICAEILDLSIAQVYIQKDNGMIYPKHIKIGIYTDYELSELCRKYFILIIDPSEVVLPKHPFTEIVRELVTRIDDQPCKISKQSFQILQKYIEFYMGTLLAKANELCKYNSRVKVTDKDIEFAFKYFKM